MVVEVGFYQTWTSPYETVRNFLDIWVSYYRQYFYVLWQLPAQRLKQLQLVQNNSINNQLSYLD